MPNVRAEAITICAPQLVLPFEWMGRGIEEVSSSFADVDKEGSFGIMNIIPEFGDGEPRSNGNSEAAEE